MLPVRVIADDLAPPSGTAANSPVLLSSTITWDWNKKISQELSMWVRYESFQKQNAEFYWTRGIMNLHCHKAQIPSTVRLHQATGLAGFVDQEKVAQSTFWAWTTAPNNSWKQKLFTMGNIQHNQHNWKVARSGPQSYILKLQWCLSVCLSG